MNLQESLTWIKPYWDVVDQIRQKAYNQAGKPSDQKLPLQCRVRTSVREGATGQIITNTHIKVSQLLAISDIETEDEAWNELYTLLLPMWLGELEIAFFDKFLLGLSWVSLVKYPGSEYPQLVHVDTGDVFWNPDKRIDRSDVYWKRVLYTRDELKSAYPEQRLKRFDGRQEFYLEYRDQTVSLIDWNMDKVWELPNPCAPYKPIFPLIYLYPSGVDIPIGDWELCKSQEDLLNETRRTMLKFARKGAGFMVARKNAFSPSEQAKLELADGETQEGIVFAAGESAGDVVYPVNTPPLPPEWLKLEQLVQADLTNKSGVSDYDRLGMPSQQVQYATEAQMINQASARRARKDLAELKLLYTGVFKAFSSWLMSDRLTGYEFTTPKGSYQIPATIPQSIVIRDMMDSQAEQLKATMLTNMFAPTIQQVQPDPIELVTQILLKTGLNAQEIESLKLQANPLAALLPLLQQAGINLEGEQPATDSQEGMNGRESEPAS